MVDYANLFSLLKPILDNKTSIKDEWGFLEIEGQWYQDAASDVNRIAGFLGSCNLKLNVKYDGKQIPVDSLADDFSKSTFTKWWLHINKLAILQPDSTGVSHNFFCHTAGLQTWLNNCDPIRSDNPLLALPLIKIIVADLNANYIGSNTQIIGLASIDMNISWTSSMSLPGVELVSNVVHVVTEGSSAIVPKRFYIEGDFTSEFGQALVRCFSIPLMAAIVHEYHSMSKVVLDGFKRMNLHLINSTDRGDGDTYKRLLEIVRWIYADKTSTKLKLFCERFTLEMNEQESTWTGILKHGSAAFRQAQQRFNFIILDRKDKYVSELKDLLKDLRTQSDLYALKIRTLLSNLLRDVIAAILLIGFTVFTKISDNLQLEKSELLEIVFNGLAVYYLLSFIFQGTVDLVDIRVSKKELSYWKQVTNELLPVGEFETHMSKSLRGRRRSLWLYGIIGLLYVSLAFACHKFPGVFNKIENNETITHDTIRQHTDSQDNCPSGRK